MDSVHIRLSYSYKLSYMGIQMFTKWLETHIFRYSWYKVDYRVIGDTGLVWGVMTTNVIVKATGTGKRGFYKSSLVFVKSEGKWKAVMAHSTPIPSEVDIFYNNNPPHEEQGHYGPALVDRLYIADEKGYLRLQEGNS
jgi:hypothetical protein